MGERAVVVATDAETMTARRYGAPAIDAAQALTLNVTTDVNEAPPFLRHQCRERRRYRGALRRRLGQIRDGTLNVDRPAYTP